MPYLRPTPRSETGEFTVGDIRIEGLQRISEGTVFNYLPVNIGDRLDQRRVEESLRALYATGFFRDVELRRDGGTLIIAVAERPSIESFTITGNKDIKTEDLEKSLRNVGLARGKTFNQSTLDEVERFLTDQYYSRGKYAVRVDTRVEELPGNRVKIAIDVAEGKRAKIRQINVVGNEAYDDETLLDEFKLRTPNWLSWYRQDDRYSREELSGDIEKLRSYYMDRGYANFDVESTQVAIAPGKDDIFITLNVKEGEVYRISDVKIAGNLVVPESDLTQLIQVHRGDIYSRKMITATTELMSLRLGQDGYAFAKIDPVPQENAQTKEIELTFLIDPGNRAYVRHIAFTGTTSINDDVLRREMRQMEGGYLSNSAVERSKQRLQRLPFIEKVEVETNPVPGTPDLVDVDVRHQGRPAWPVQRRRRLLRVAVGDPERQLRAQQLHGHGQSRRGRDQCRPVQQGLQSLAHRSVHDGRRHLAHGLGNVPQDRSVHARVVRFRDRDRHARGRLRLADQRSSSRCAWASPPSGRICSPIRTRARTRRSIGCRTTAIPTRSRRSSASLRCGSISTAPSSTRSSCRWAGVSTRATARCSPTAARVIGST